MMQRESFLENIVLSCIDHQKTLAMGVGAFSFLYPYHTGEWEPSFWTSATPAYLTYLTLGSIREHLFSRDYRDLRTDSLAERTRRYVFDHIKPLTIVSGAALASLYYVLASPQGKFVEEHPPRLIGEYATQIVWPAAMAVNQITLSLFKQHHRMMQSLRAWKERQLLNEEQHTFAERAARGWNFLFEHPFAVGLIVGGYHLFRQCPEGGAFPLWDKVECGLRTTYATALGAFGTALVGGLLHSSGLAYYKNAFLAHAYRFIEKRKDAVASLEKTLALPTSHAMMIERRLALADVLLDNGDEQKAMKYYREAAILFSHPENQRLASPDLLQHLLFRRHISLEHRFEQIAESSHEVMEYSPSPRSRHCFVFKRSEDHHSLEREYYLHRTLETLVAENGLLVKPPLSLACFHAPDKKTYHVMLRTHAPSVGAVFRPLFKKFYAGSQKAHERIVELTHHVVTDLAQLHGAITPHLQRDERGFFFPCAEAPSARVDVPVWQYKDYFVDRVIRGKPSDHHPRLGPLGYRERLFPVVDNFVEAAHDLFSPLQRYSVFFTHGDTACRHFLLDHTLLDFERAAVGNPFVDLAQFFHETGLPPPQFLPTYLTVLQREGGFQLPDAEEQMKLAYLYHSFCRLGSSAGHLPRGIVKGIRRRYLRQKFGEDMFILFTVLDEFHMEDVKRKFIDALAFSGLRSSPYLEYDQLMLEARKRY